MYLRQCAAAIEAEKDSLARLLTLERGKPYLTQSLAEIQAAIDCLRGTASLRLYAKVLRDTPAGRIEAHRVPMGVVGASDFYSGFHVVFLRLAVTFRGDAFLQRRHGSRQ